MIQLLVEPNAFAFSEASSDNYWMPNWDFIAIWHLSRIMLENAVWTDELFGKIWSGSSTDQLIWISFHHQINDLLNGSYEIDLIESLSEELASECAYSINWQLCDVNTLTPTPRQMAKPTWHH